MPGTEQAINAAAQRGYEAIVLVLLVLAGFSCLGVIVRQLWTDHRALNEYVRITMAGAIDRNSRAMTKLARILADRPCLADLDEQVENETDQPGDDSSRR